jgi:hypothetical protein
MCFVDILANTEGHDEMAKHIFDLVYAWQLPVPQLLHGIDRSTGQRKAHVTWYDPKYAAKKQKVMNEGAVKRKLGWGIDPPETEDEKAKATANATANATATATVNATANSSQPAAPSSSPKVNFWST